MEHTSRRPPPNLEGEAIGAAEKRGPGCRGGGGSRVGCEQRVRPPSEGCVQALKGREVTRSVSGWVRHEVRHEEPRVRAAGREARAVQPLRG
jgi:hypothetical protein